MTQELRNLVYGSLALGMISLTAAYIDAHVPNSLWYYIDLYLPF